MSKLPDGWTRIKFGDCFQVLSGYGFQKSEYVESGIPLLRIDNVSYGQIRWSSIAFLPESYVDDYPELVLRANDILLALNRPITNNQLKIARLKSTDVPSILYQRVGKIIPLSDGIIHEFTFYLLQYYLYFFVQRNAIGSDQPYISLRELYNFELPLPPLAEQRKIAEILSTWDEAIQLVESLIVALKERKRGLMQRLLTGEVRFPGFDGEWEEVQIGEVGEIRSGGTPDTNNPAYWDGDIAWVTPTEITALSTKYIDGTRRTITHAGLRASSARIIEPLSIILCTRATIGDAAINLIPMATNQGFKNLTLGDGHNPEFFYYLITQNKHQLKRLANGSTFLELSKSDFERIRFFVPAPDEQMKIAEIINQFDVYIEGAYQYIAHLREQKKGLMQRLLTGEVRV